MNNEILQKEFDMPQLRQMVLDNTEKIEKNELTINKMRMEAVEQTHKNSERDEKFETFYKEHDRYMKNINETLDRIALLSETSRIEQARRSRELDEQFKETDRRIRENSEQLKETQKQVKEMYAETKEMFAETDRQVKGMYAETKEMFAETDRQVKGIYAETKEMFAETDRQVKGMYAETKEMFAETDRQVKGMYAETKEMFAETDRQVKGMYAETKEMFAETTKRVEKMFAETNESIRRVSVEFLGVTGHIVEGLVRSSTVNIFKEAGYDLHDSGKNLKRELPSENKKIEVDALLSNESVVIPVEVKAHFTKKKVKRFIRKMEMFKKFFPEYADKEVVAAIAAIHYEADADTFAHDEGLLVIRVNSNDIFSLDPIDESKLRKF
ncbi:MAG: hypothetical protein IKZ54_06595 [Bacteroidales bacterium]|nr:hypothetical protein [Bacteroidales bacterium]